MAAESGKGLSLGWALRRGSKVRRGILLILSLSSKYFQGSELLELEVTCVTIECLVKLGRQLSSLRAPRHPTCYKCGCVGSKIGAHVCA